LNPRDLKAVLEADWKAMERSSKLTAFSQLVKVSCTQFRLVKKGFRETISLLEH
jgi:hypothetical protein